MIEVYLRLLMAREFANLNAFLSAGKARDACVFQEFLDNADENPLACAATEGAFTVLQHLIVCGANVNLRPFNGFTAVFNSILASVNQPAGLLCLAHLLKSGASANATGNMGMRPLTLAAINGAHAAFQLLLFYGADPHLSTEDSHDPATTYKEIFRRGLHEYQRTLADAGFAPRTYDS